MARKRIKQGTPEWDKLVASEKARIGNPNRPKRTSPITAQQEKLHNQLRKRHRSTPKAQSNAGSTPTPPASQPRPKAPTTGMGNLLREEAKQKQKPKLRRAK
jgi:hypothetical protein